MRKIAISLIIILLLLTACSMQTRDTEAIEITWVMRGLWSPVTGSYEDDIFSGKFLDIQDEDILIADSLHDTEWESLNTLVRNGDLVIEAQYGSRSEYGLRLANNPNEYLFSYSERISADDVTSAELSLKVTNTTTSEVHYSKFARIAEAD